jgi:hypothetical protein
MTAVRMSYGQTFSEYIEELPTLPCPQKFRSVSGIQFLEKDLPNHLFDHTQFDLSTRKARAKIELDPIFPIIIVKNTSSNSGYSSSTLFSFNAQGDFQSVLLVAHSADGEGSTYSITPENKIRIANYGASEAIISTYRYENGQFIKEGELEYGDVDNLPEY